MCKEVVSAPEFCAKLTFPLSLKQPGPRSGPIQCYIKRNKAASTYHLFLGLTPAYESAEMRTLAESLTRDIIRGSPDVKWKSIKGLETTKRLPKEAVVMPIKYPKYVV